MWSSGSNGPFSPQTPTNAPIVPPNSGPATHNPGRRPGRKIATLIFTAPAMLRTTGNPRIGRFAGWVFVLIGLPIMGLGWHLLQKERARVARSVRTTGVVETLENSRYSSPVRARTSSSTAPTIRYRDATGHDYTFTASGAAKAATRPADYAVGERVTVYYDPARPYDARLHGFLAQWMGPAMVIGMGLVFALLGWMCVAAATADTTRVTPD